MERGLAIDDRVRIVVTEATAAAGIGGCEGVIEGFTVPASSGVDVIGVPDSGLAYNVVPDGHDEGRWVAAELVEVIVRGGGRLQPVLGESGWRLRDGRDRWWWSYPTRAVVGIRARRTALRPFVVSVVDRRDVGATLAVLHGEDRLRWKERRLLLETLAELDAVPELIDLLDDGDEDIRREAAAALAVHASDERVGRALLDVVLRPEDELVQREALFSLVVGGRDDLIAVARARGLSDFLRNELDAFE
jgi:hypothetical protein